MDDFCIKMKYSANILLFFISLALNAQVDQCAFVYDMQKFFPDSVSLEKFIIEKNNKLSKSNERVLLRDEITIPVVFHIFNKEDSENKVTLPDIYEQLDILNKAFSAKNYDIKNVPGYFMDFIGNPEISFCIGVREQDGKKQKGVLMYTTGESYFADQIVPSDNKRMKIKHKSFGGSDAWDSKKYINIWIGEMAFNKGTSTFPGIDASYQNEEGIIINSYNLVRGSSAKKTIVHEMGHYFDLNHIWGRKPGCDYDDDVEDTPLQYSYYTGCPAGEKISCNSKDMYMNYMDYTDDYCSLMFTKGQVARMTQSIYTFRNTLTMSDDLCDIQVDIDIFKNIKVFEYQNSISIFRGTVSDADLDVEIFDLQGRKIYSGIFQKSETVKNIPGIFNSSGLYLVLLKKGKEFNVKKIAVLR